MSYVYLIRSEEGLFKIGVSNNPKSRLKALQSATPHNLTLIHAVQTNISRKIELYLHGYYHTRAIRGEWFALSDSDVNKFVSEVEWANANLGGSVSNEH